MQVLTVSGRCVSIVDPKWEDIWIDDIGYHLSGLYRFNGGTRFLVSQHSLVVSDYLYRTFNENECLALAGLLHDSPEAYLGDQVRPLKGLMLLDGSPIEEYHDRLLKIILNKYCPGYTNNMLQAVQAADDFVNTWEKEYVVNRKVSKHCKDYLTNPLTPESACKAFMKRYHELAR